ncbi:MAG: hypothetical protein AAF081_15600 [Actinomycetota bacterium]
MTSTVEPNSQRRVGESQNPETSAGDADGLVETLRSDLESLQRTLDANRAEHEALLAGTVAPVEPAAAPPPVAPPSITPPSVPPMMPPTIPAAPNSPVAAAPAAEAGTSSLGPIVETVNEIVKQAKTAAADRIAAAEVEAAGILERAHEQAALTLAEAERVKADAERDAQEYRVETMAHASRVQAETEKVLERVRVDAAETMADIERQVATELVARLQVVRESERAVLDRLAATADAITRCLAWFDEPDVRLAPEIDLRIAPSPTEERSPS